MLCHILSQETSGANFTRINIEGQDEVIATPDMLLLTDAMPRNHSSQSKGKNLATSRKFYEAFLL